RERTLSQILVNLFSAARDFLYNNRVAETGLNCTAFNRRAHREHGVHFCFVSLRSLRYLWSTFRRIRCFVFFCVCSIITYFARYCSSLTCSIQSTTLPLSAS